METPLKEFVDTALTDTSVNNMGICVSVSGESVCVSMYSMYCASEVPLPASATRGILASLHLVEV